MLYVLFLRFSMVLTDVFLRLIYGLHFCFVHSFILSIPALKLFQITFL